MAKKDFKSQAKYVKDIFDAFGDMAGISFDSIDPVEFIRMHQAREGHSFDNTQNNSYQWIRREAKRLDCPYKQLIVLDDKNDPFYMGKPADLQRAKWFAHWWRKAGFKQPTHLRRFHYWLVSQSKPVPLPRPIGSTRTKGNVRKEFTTYQNHIRCFEMLVDAGKQARYLRMVDVGDIKDENSPDPNVFAAYGWSPQLSIDIPDFDFPISVYGISEQNAQPYHLEVWVEKTTMNDVLAPVCERFGANLVAFQGEATATAVLKSLQERVEGSKTKPTRIWYISDFDPSGANMPKAVARKIEWVVRELNHDLDIRLKQLALTAEQVEKYQLPGVPIKDSDRKKASFIEKYGARATELDALEVIRPGVLADMLRVELLHYTSEEAITEAGKLESRLLIGAGKRVKAITRKYKPEMKALERMIEELKEIDTDISEHEQEPSDPHIDEDDDWLFDSQREYGEQLAHYRK